MLLFCVAVGLVISHFSKFHWIPISLSVLFAVLINGVLISVEDNEPGGWSHDPNATDTEKSEFKKMVRIQIAITLAVLALAVYAGVKFSS